MTPTMDEVMQVVHRYTPKGFAPMVAMILGSGLSAVAEQMTNVVSIPYTAIPGIEGGNISGHASLLAMGYLNDVPVVCLRGRLHLYEGIHPESIRILIHIVRHLGCHTILSTGAVGSLREEVGPGELVMITDHINFQPLNPMVGANDESVGPRFFGMEDAYDLGVQDLFMAAADKFNITLHKGVYLSTIGPSFETPAEIRAFKIWGADVVGMSVVPEVIIARHCGLRVGCIAAVTNLAAGLDQEKITHEGTLQFGAIAARNLTKIFPEVVKGIE